MLICDPLICDPHRNEKVIGLKCKFDVDFLLANNTKFHKCTK
jgi:hypothetical protein